MNNFKQIYLIYRCVTPGQRESESNGNKWESTLRYIQMIFHYLTLEHE